MADTKAVLEGLDRLDPASSDPQPVPPGNPFADLVDEHAPELTSSDGPRQGLGDIFADEWRKGQEGTGIGFAKDLSTKLAPDGRETRERFDARYALQPQYDTPLEWAAAAGGRLLGAAASPENFIPIGAGKWLLEGAGGSLATVRARIFAGAVDAAAANAAVDAAVQGADIAAGFRDSFDIGELAVSTGLGAIIGGAAGPLTHRLPAREGAAAPDAPAARPADIAPDNPFRDEIAAPPPAPAPAKDDAAPSADPNIGKVEAVAADLKAMAEAAGRDILDAPGGRPTGTKVRVADDQAGVAAGMVRVTDETGQSTVIGDRLLGPEPKPAAPLPLAAAPVTAQEPAPALGDRLAAEADSRQSLPTKAQPAQAKAGPPKVGKPVSLTRWLAQNGGVKEYEGTLKGLGLDKTFVPGSGRLMREGGLDLDHAREIAAEAGYFHQYGSIEEAMQRSTVADLVDLLAEEAGGRPVYTRADTERLAMESGDAKAAETRERYDAARAEIDDTAPELPPRSESARQSWSQRDTRSMMHWNGLCSRTIMPTASRSRRTAHAFRGRMTAVILSNQELLENADRFLKRATNPGLSEETKGTLTRAAEHFRALHAIRERRTTSRSASQPPPASTEMPSA